MKMQGQFTIAIVNDFTTSELPPENPYIGQIWQDISQSPPVLKQWIGTDWEPYASQENLDKTEENIMSDIEFIQELVNGEEGLSGKLDLLNEIINGAEGSEDTGLIEALSKLKDDIEQSVIEMYNSLESTANDIVINASNLAALQSTVTDLGQRLFQEDDGVYIKSIVDGKENIYKVKITNTGLQILESKYPVAEFMNDGMNTGNIVARKSVKVGDYIWTAANDRLTLSYKPG